MAMPVLVCLGTTAVLELRRMAMRGPEARQLDELKASEQKLTKIVQAMEKELEKEKAATATASERAASLAATSEALRKVQQELRDRAKAAEALAGQEKKRAEAAEKAAEQARKDAAAAADKLEAALESLKKDVAKALAKFAKGGFGEAIGSKKKGWQQLIPGVGKKTSNSEAFLEHMKKLGVDVDATPAELDALASAAAAAEAEAKIAAATKALEESKEASKNDNKGNGSPSSAASAPLALSDSAPRFELSVDATTWARQLRLVCNDPVRISRALAVSGIDAASAAAAGIGGSGGGGRFGATAISATSLNPAVAAAAALASSSPSSSSSTGTAAASTTLPLPFQRALPVVKSPPRPRQRSLPPSPVKEATKNTKENVSSSSGGGEQKQQQQRETTKRAPASPPKPPPIEPESPRPASQGRRFVLRPTAGGNSNAKANDNKSSGAGRKPRLLGANIGLRLEEEAAVADMISSTSAGAAGGDLEGLSRSIIRR